MDSKPGTVEVLIQNASFFLQPMFAAIEDDGIQAFLEIDMEVDIPPGTFQGSALAGELTQCKTAVTTLFTIVEDLKTAFRDNDISTIGIKALEAIEQIRNISASLEQLQGVADIISGTLAEPLASQLKDYCETLLGRIIMLLTIIYTDNYLMRLETLSLLGILDKEPVTFGDTVPKTVLQEKIFFNRIADIVQSPVGHLKSIYRWGETDFNGGLLLERLSRFLIQNNMPVTFNPATASQTASITFDFFEIRHHKQGTLQGLSFLHKFPLPDNFSIQYPLSNLWTLDLKIVGGFKEDFSWLIAAPGDFSILSSNEINAGIALAISGASPIPSEKLSLLSLTNIGRVDATTVKSLVEFNYSSGASLADSSIDLILETSIVGGELEVTFGDDGFLSSVSESSSFKASFDLSFRWSLKGGLQVKGSGGPEISIPVHIDAGPISITHLTIALHPSAEAIPIDVSANIRALLGPLTIVIDRIGLRSTFGFPGTGGNLGPLDLGIGFKPPEGLGLSIDAGGIKGGGFLKFDPDKGEYFGAMELEFQDMFSMKALGILNTKMPDGSKGFSFLIIITAEFTPIQLGFGFTLNGVGGLLGMNRTVRIDVLKEGIKTNAIKSILFPEDVVANINRIVSDIKQVFPQQQGHFLICPMGKLGWGTPSIITLELGLLIEIPVTRIAILGVLKALLPEESAPLLRLQVNFLGVIDFENKFISFDASLFDSRLLIYTLTGDMAFRLSFGDKPVFILTVGGFHPAFKEVPGDLQNLRRITLSLLSGNNPRITIQNYFAITSNTVQFGAKAELYAEGGGFNIYGFIGYDVLFRLEPLQFIADFSAGLALRRKTSVVMGIHVEGQLSGTSPWDARGKASISFFFFSISVSFHETWGDPAVDVPPQKEDLIELLTREISDNRNWNAEIPANNKLHVSIKQITPAANKIAVHPFGVLTFSERLVPLELDINKFGNKVPKDASRFEIKSTDPNLSTEPAREQFAPANFIAMKDEEKLSRPSFEEMKSGFKITGSAALQAPAKPVSKSVDYEFSYLGKKRTKLVFAGVYHYAKLFFRAGTKAAAVSNSSLSHVNNRVSLNAPEPVAIQPEQFAIANLSDMKLHSNELVAGSYTEAQQFYNELVKKQPALKDQVQIVFSYELNPSLN